MIKSKNSYKKMKISVRLSGVLVAFLIFSCQVYAQSNAINKLLNKKEYEAAFEKITSAYKDTNDLERMELMFKYYSAVDNPSFNSCLAYSYANRYNLQTAGDKIELDDFVRTSLDIAFKSGSIEELEQFIECFKEQTTYVKEAMRLVEQLAFEQASMEGTLEAFERYVEKYPASLQSSLAKQNIDKLIVEQILESDDLQTLRDFAATSNNKQHVSKAKAKIEKLMFSKALETNTAEAYKEYLSEYPEGSYHKLAKQRMEEVLYNSATKNGNIIAMSDFVKHNKNHPQWYSVLEQLKQKTFSQLSLVGMQTIMEAESDETLLNKFANLYLADTRKQVADTLLAYFPSLSGSSAVQKADRARKNIETLLSKQTITSDDFKANHNLFYQKGNIQSFSLVMHYIETMKSNKAFNKQVYSSLTLVLQQSEWLPLFVQSKSLPPSRELKANSEELIFTRSNRGFCYESSHDNNDIFRLEQNNRGETDTILLPCPINTRYNETNPVLSPDKKTLYFSSNAGVNYGGLDIYVSHRENEQKWDNWSEPILLGAEVNTKGDDIVLEADEKEIVVRSGKTEETKIISFETEPAFIDGYLLDQSGRFLKGEVLILDSLTLDTLFITHSNDKGYFAYFKPDQPYILHSQMQNHIHFFSSDLSQIVVRSIDDLISTKKLCIVETPFEHKKRNKLSDRGRRNLEYFAKSVKNMNYTITISVHIHSEEKPEKAAAIASQQADLLANFLIKHGIAKNKIIVVGYGSDSPLIGWEGKDRIEIGFLNN